MKYTDDELKAMFKELAEEEQKEFDRNPEKREAAAKSLLDRIAKQKGKFANKEEDRTKKPPGGKHVM